MAFSNLRAPYSALRICVDQREGERLSGMVFSQRLTEPMVFTDIGTLVLRLDEVLDQQNFPQAFQQTRSFTGRVSHVPAAESPELGLPAQLVDEAYGHIATFEVTVMSRRAASWQGFVNWLDDTPHEEFSSALELIRQIEERLCQH